jgi:CRP/FNR family transcriptional regulator, anaerobic regulatory protein
MTTSTACTYISPVPVFNHAEAHRHCSSCGMHELCLAKGLDEVDMHQLDLIIGRRRKILKGELLFRVNDPLSKLYAVRLGHFKTHKVTPSGEEQIVGFQMAGELLGWDGIAGERHLCDATALEDSEVCEIPFAKLETLLGTIPVLLQRFHRLMSQEITREQGLMLLLGNMRAEQRMAVFLTNLAARYAARGYSSTQFQLRMSREDIGTYLGLTIESISRLFSRFKKMGLVKIDNRQLQLLDPPRLKSMAAGTVVCD